MPAQRQIERYSRARAGAGFVAAPEENTETPDPGRRGWRQTKRRRDHRKSTACRCRGGSRHRGSRPWRHPGHAGTGPRWPRCSSSSSRQNSRPPHDVPAVGTARTRSRSPAQQCGSSRVSAVLAEVLAACQVPLVIGEVGIEGKVARACRRCARVRSAACRARPSYRARRRRRDRWPPKGPRPAAGTARSARRVRGVSARGRSLRRDDVDQDPRPATAAGPGRHVPAFETRQQLAADNSYLPRWRWWSSL